NGCSPSSGNPVRLQPKSLFGFAEIRNQHRGGEPPEDLIAFPADRDDRPDYDAAQQRVTDETCPGSATHERRDTLHDVVQGIDVPIGVDFHVH
ncbi:hypothetical protein, partial [Burkholderia vietnamiensis]|uniref:hypothetical protein n=1 Tax=Burkholderia vietnamiensis TaxID=60552 RepID=UPI001E2AAD5A